MIVRNPGRKHVALFDLHIPWNIDLREVLGYIYDTGPDKVILGGDNGNWEFCSHWNDPLFKAMGPIIQKEKLEEEADQQVKVFREIRKASGKAEIYCILGNHEAWVWHAVLNYGLYPLPFKSKDIKFNTDLAKMMDAGLRQMITNLLDCKRLGITVLDYNEPLKIGKLVYLHGHQFSSGPLHNATGKRWPHCNLVIGHRHAHEVVPVFNQSDPTHYYEHVCVPSLSPLAPGYDKDKSTRHSNGFWVADFDSKTGLFDGRVRKVFNGRLIPSQN